MKFRRGFKAQANRIAREVRLDLGLAAHSPLDPFQLAEHLGIPVWTAGDTLARDGLKPGLLEECTKHFSAVTVFAGRRRVIVHNELHSRNLQRANLAHELAHALLIHEPHAALDLAINRTHMSAMEHEANWLGPALLISEEAALSIANGKMSDIEAALRTA